MDFLPHYRLYQGSYQSYSLSRHNFANNFCDPYTSNSPTRAGLPDWFIRTAVYTKLLCLWLQYSTYWTRLLLTIFSSKSQKRLYWVRAEVHLAPNPVFNNNQKQMPREKHRNGGNIQRYYPWAHSSLQQLEGMALHRVFWRRFLCI